jgi:hypothetical protein
MPLVAAPVGDARGVVWSAGVGCRQGCVCEVRGTRGCGRRIGVVAARGESAATSDRLRTAWLGQVRFQRSCQSMSLAVMIRVMARASWASRWRARRSVLRRS